MRHSHLVKPFIRRHCVHSRDTHLFTIIARELSLVAPPLLITPRDLVNCVPRSVSVVLPPPGVHPISVICISVMASTPVVTAHSAGTNVCSTSRSPPRPSCDHLDASNHPAWTRAVRDELDLLGLVMHPLGYIPQPSVSDNTTAAGTDIWWYVDQLALIRNAARATQYSTGP